MATPRIITSRDFNTSRFAQLADSGDVDLNAVLAGAETAVERMIGRPIAATTFVEQHQPATSEIYLRRRPVLSIVGINRRASMQSSVVTPLASTSYHIDLELGLITLFTAAIGLVFDVTYVAGFDPVPEDIKQAIILKTAMLLFQDYEIYGSGDGKKPGITYMNDEIEMLIKPYRVNNIAFTR